MDNLLRRFLRYVAVETTSDENSKSQPSTHSQWTLLKMLYNELREMGVANLSLDDNGYLMATIPANCDLNIPTIGFISHVDTSPEASGKNVRPRVIRNYDGTDIILNHNINRVLSPKTFPDLLQYLGQTLIVTDGTTLLGADDKAGVAEIMTFVSYMIENEGFRHGEIAIAFTPDEEIGRGVAQFDVSSFGATYAYTVDGGAIGELEYENFNAAAAIITIEGTNIHPGSAKDKMCNSQLIAMELNARLPVLERPECTSGYEGFYLLTNISGSIDTTTMHYIIRDFYDKTFNEKLALLTQIVEELNHKYGQRITIEIQHQYSNMRMQIEPHAHIIDVAREAMVRAGVTPIIQPIRGGTDGAHLSYMGLPCPNLFAGGHNFHSVYEYVPLQSMEKSVEVLANIAQIFVEKSHCKKSY